MSNGIEELLEDFDLEVFLDDNGIEYSVKHGNSGEQLNLKECPRCGGSGWKVFINRETGVGNCFHGSCVDDPWFNKLKFVSIYSGVSYGEALRSIRKFNEDLGWRPKEKTSSRKQVKEVDLSSLKLPESHELPTASGNNLKYLNQRGVTKEQTKKHGLRYCENGYHEYDSAEGKKRQYFTGRVLVPIKDMKGNLVTFQGRDISGDAQRKYLMASGLPATGRYLYNSHNCVGNECITLCEGVFSVYGAEEAFRKHGVDSGVVGTFGKSLSTNLDNDSQLSQILTLKREGLKKIVFMWDAEDNTIESARKEALALQKVTGLKCFVAELPDGEDPGSASHEEIVKAFEEAYEVNWRSMIKMRMGK